jgi:hypothetical protein
MGTQCMQCGSKPTDVRADGGIKQIVNLELSPSYELVCLAAKDVLPCTCHGNGVAVLHICWLCAHRMRDSWQRHE